MTRHASDNKNAEITDTQRNSDEGFFPSVELNLSKLVHGGYCIGHLNPNSNDWDDFPQYRKKTFFVRFGLPGEKVKVYIDSQKKKVVFAYVVEVLSASKDRQNHPWLLADSLKNPDGPLLGGMDYGHIIPESHAFYKTQVIEESLQRFAPTLIAQYEKETVRTHDSDRLVEVKTPQEVAQSSTYDGPTQFFAGSSQSPELGWRSRIHFHIDQQGCLSMSPEGSDELIPVSSMPLAPQEVDELKLWDVNFSPAVRLDVSVASDDPAPKNHSNNQVYLKVLVEASVSSYDAMSLYKKLERHIAAIPTTKDVQIVIDYSESHGADNSNSVPSQAWNRHIVAYTDGQGHRKSANYIVEGSGFWQVHHDAPKILGNKVLEHLKNLNLRQQKKIYDVIDLYSGAGLFSTLIAQRYPGAKILALEGSRQAHADSQENIKHISGVVAKNSNVAGYLHSMQPHARVVVLDPPRDGAGYDVMRYLDKAIGEKIIYVACDPVSLARDIGYLDPTRWKLSSVEGFDIYPYTSHVETIAVVERKSSQKKAESTS